MLDFALGLIRHFVGFGYWTLCVTLCIFMLILLLAAYDLYKARHGDSNNSSDRYQKLRIGCVSLGGYRTTFGLFFCLVFTVKMAKRILLTPFKEEQILRNVMICTVGSNYSIRHLRAVGNRRVELCRRLRGTIECTYGMDCSMAGPNSET